MAAIVATPVPLEQIGKLKGPQFGSKGVACLATDGAHVYAGCRDHAIRVYDARTHKLLYALGAPAGPLDVAREGHVGCVTCLKLCGRRLFSGGGDRTLRAWDVKDRGPLRKVGEHGAIVTALAVAGATLCSADADGFVGLWDLETLAAVGELEAKPSIYALAVVGPVLFAARGEARSWPGRRKRGRTRRRTPPRACSRSARNSTWDATTAQSASGTRRGRRRCRRRSAEHGGVTALASMEGSVVVSGGEDGAVVCWDAAARTRRWATRPREGAVNGADAIVADDSGCLFSASPMAPHVQVWSGRNRRTRSRRNRSRRTRSSRSSRSTGARSGGGGGAARGTVFFFWCFYCTNTPLIPHRASSKLLP